ncbi:helix-turn-helix transcriptional regulator [Brevibacillus laterosporus]|uniref:helix-turn-helix transcriptional regulator n=1 Tax=Brevibacillus laterosporus TaxID=1465 RepID=UPI00265622FC|nr:helix-turn-helix transcriptional regulator [Brevibacillus laterosporus]MDN9010989.1 helix-turn-helix transcriptional regulator [Brevibacillus laterosporus]MDO0942012.1 helix-turn-helix transcriptional regulator [Brevibacillus laterosporus]
MTQNISYTTEEVANILRVSKLTVYDLIKKGELSAYRVGRQMRVDASDLESYKLKTKSKKAANTTSFSQAEKPIAADKPSSGGIQSIIISGQDMALDLLASQLENQTGSIRALRSYQGSLNSLVSLYRGEAQIVSTHLFDGDSGTYNLPYVQRVLTGRPYLIVHMMARQAGLYVAKGNPLQLRTWSDLQKSGVRIVNREVGSGTRVLLDEQLRLHQIDPARLSGYFNHVEHSHLAVATAVARGAADVGIGIEKAARIVDVEFIPLIQEHYDLVMLVTPQSHYWINSLLKLLQSEAFKQELQAIGGYDVTLTGQIKLKGPIHSW